MPQRRLRFAVLLLLLTLGCAALGYIIQTRQASMAEAAEVDIGAWSCPMHPQIVSDHEGTCPICGMALVKTSSGKMVPHDAQFHVPAASQQRMGLLTEELRHADFRPTLRVPAQIVADERRAVSLSPKVDGWIKRLGVSVVGQQVRKGQVLFELYSPELQQRQRDYIDMLARRDTLSANAGGMGAAVGNATPDLMLGSVARERYRMRARLAAADVPQAVLDDLEKSRRVHEVVPVLAEHDGVVTAIGAREGAYVMPSQTVVSYADLTAVWAELSLSQEQLGQLRGRGDVLLRSSVDPSVRVTLHFDAAQAVVDPASRTARLRVPMPAARGGFPAGTLADAEIRLPGRQALALQQDSIIRTGHGDFVIVADGADHFRQVEVALGAQAGDRVEVRSGLESGQRVVTNGQFLLSAEATLQAARRRLSAHAAP